MIWIPLSGSQIRQPLNVCTVIGQSSPCSIEGLVCVVLVYVLYDTIISSHFRKAQFPNDMTSLNIKGHFCPMPLPKLSLLLNARGRSSISGRWVQTHQVEGVVFYILPEFLSKISP